ncbi:MAG: flagellar type III secretion system pore protein FliP [Oscillospiraceae bacterium]|nr:flagellar type III secretion system pore protein FliP [Oscillospiraceae bacterium]MCI9548704.1 flagellar type III secretion system pore protein FliP [Oscillospiraceae bacterium]
MPTDSLININGGSVQTLEILFLTTLIALLPSMLVMMTCFARYIISMSFLRTAMGTQQTPPNVVLVGIALFLTLITMDPVIGKIQTEAWEPYRDQEIGGEEFIERSADALKEYMLHDTQLNTLRMYCDLAHVEVPEDDAGLREEAMDLSLRVIVPAFMTQELQRAFYTGLLLYIPFLLIDIVVSSTLMSMGMIMLPPAMISTPFKLLLFVSVNGWDLLFSSLVQGVN